MKELKFKHLMAASEDAFLLVENDFSGRPIKTEEDLVCFLENEASIPFEDGGLSYRMFVVENFSETESVLIFKCHHSLADGMSLIGLLTSMQDHYSIDQLREFGPQFPWWKKLLLWICLPFSMLTGMFFVLF